MTVFFCVCDCILLDVGLCHYYIMDNKIPQCQYPGNTLKYQAGKKKKILHKRFPHQKHYGTLCCQETKFKGKPSSFSLKDSPVSLYHRLPIILSRCKSINQRGEKSYGA